MQIYAMQLQRIGFNKNFEIECMHFPREMRDLRAYNFNLMDVAFSSTSHILDKSLASNNACSILRNAC